MCNILVDEYRKSGMLDEFEELKCMLKMKCFCVEIFFKNFVDLEFEIELVIDLDFEIELVVDDEVKFMIFYDFK